MAFGRSVPLVALAALLVAGPALAIGSFSPSAFKFATTVPDDGKADPAGWQEASAELNFVDTRSIIPHLWSCRVRVGMPLRTGALGPVSPESAAEMSAGIATEASGTVIHSRPEWLGAEFCVAFKEEMTRLFRRDHPSLAPE